MAYKCLWVCLLCCNASSSSAGSGSVVYHLVASSPGFPGTSFTHWESLRTSPTHFSVPHSRFPFPWDIIYSVGKLGDEPNTLFRFPFPFPISHFCSHSYSNSHSHSHTHPVSHSLLFQLPRLQCHFSFYCSVGCSFHLCSP